MYRIDRLSNGLAIEITHNCSLSWEAAKAVITVICALITAVALYFASIGAWLVLPFSGLEIILVISAFYLIHRKFDERELIELEEDQVKISHGRESLTPLVSMNKYWVKVKIIPDRKDWHRDRLFLHSHGKYIEIGKSLANTEKHKLFTKLKQLLTKEIRNVS